MCQLSRDREARAEGARPGSISLATGLASSPMNYGFLIDNRKCIGCHACSTACKSENEVPLGVNRTWVKYTETGVFPETRRHFQVTRCNHCANPPCVHICPVTAMYQREDGIVEFDPEACIGCKACIQACPYDAVYIDPDSHTAAKCHFCAHRVDVGLEPACVVVCPEHAILAGDLDDPASEIARVVASAPVQVRKGEQGTKPKLFYIDATEASLVPMAARQDTGMLWAAWPDHGEGDWRGPISIEEGRMANAMVRDSAPRETYNVPHRVPWHWQVPAYLVAKGIGAGAFIIAALNIAFGFLPADLQFTNAALLLSLVFIGINTALLVWDLDRPARFLFVLTRPQWRSWLAKGAFALVAFSMVAGLMLIGSLAGLTSLAYSPLLLWPGVALAIITAVYTAFLFGQAEGRDLWQSSLLPLHMFVQSIMAGAAALLLLAIVMGSGGRQGAAVDMLNTLAWVFLVSLVANIVVTLIGDLLLPHRGAVAAAAARMLLRGRYARHYWIGVAGGLFLPLVLLMAAGASPLALIAAPVLAIVGLFFYEWGFVMAPQQVPNN